LYIQFLFRMSIWHLSYKNLRTITFNKVLNLHKPYSVLYITVERLT